jgi:deoxyadenosine/deoxycytidine kinase
VRPLIVEFTGARGVGKSTLAALVEKKLEERAAVSSKMKRLPPYGELYLAACRLPRQLRSTLIFLSWRPVSWDEMRRFSKRFRRYLVYMQHMSRASGIQLLDDGIFQLMLMLYGKTTQKDMSRIAATLRRLTPFPDVVVSVQASQQDIEARRLKRGNARDLLKLRMSPGGRQALAGMQRVLGEISRQDHGFRLIVVQNGSLADLEAAASRVANEILAIHAEARLLSAPRA